MEATFLWVVMWGACAVAAAIVAAHRSAGIVGLILGAIFGPLGVLIAFRLDDRPECSACRTKLDRMARVCRGCRLPVRFSERWRLMIAKGFEVKEDDDTRAGSPPTAR